MNGGTVGDGSENNENTADTADGVIENGGLTNGGTEHDHGDDSNSGGGGGGGENRLLFDFSNDMMFDSSGRLMRKPRRKHNPDRDKYIQEPQYVTKRTSSGRLVKMKISTDFDYTSDQEEEGKRRRKEEDDDDTMEGIQAKHRKEGDMAPEYGQFAASHRRVHRHRHRTASDNDDCSSMSSDSSGDEDFLGNKYSSKRASVSGTKPKRTYTRTPRRPGSGSSSSRRLTVKELTAGGNNPGGIFDSDDSGSSQEEFILPRSMPFKTTVSPAGPSSSSTASTQPVSSKLTFDQYVKKLSTGGSCTVGQALAMADAAKSAGGAGGLTSSNTAMTARPPLTKVNSPSSLMTTSSTSKPGLTVPIINPAIKTILSKLNAGNQPIQQTPAGNRIILNASASTGPSEHTKQTVKLIAVNSTSTTNASGMSDFQIFVHFGRLST